MIKTPVVKIREILIGGGHPVAIQSMTNTLTGNARETAKQCMELANSGSELVRITVNDGAAAKAVPEIRKILDKNGYKFLPLIGDFHFNGHTLLTKFPKCAEILDKYRINPGNVGYGKSHDENFGVFIRLAKKFKKPVRIGVNAGSLDRELLTLLMDENKRRKIPLSSKEILVKAMVKSAFDSALLAEELGLRPGQIVLSVKMSDTLDVIKAYEDLSKLMQKENRIYALHLGLTEAGSGREGIVHSTSALSILLRQGIGDTIRVSLTPEKNSDRTKEVFVCKDILQSLGLRSFSPRIISCPGCGRTDNALFQKMVMEIKKSIEEKSCQLLKLNPRFNQMKIAVMGCAVNGPGESMNADIGISLPGHTEEKIALVYARQKFLQNLTGKNIPSQFIKLLEKFLPGL